MTYQLDKPVAERLKAFFEPFDFIDKVVIFGSRAKHNANPKSDIDLCIYSLEMSDAQFSKLKLSLDELPILYKIDVVHFEKSNEALRVNVAKDGKLFFMKMVTLEDLENDKSIIVSKGKQLPQEYRDNGQIKVIGAGQKSPYLSCHANFEGQTITISSSGAYAGYVWFHNYPLWASDCTVIQVKNKVDINYLYLFLKSKQELIYSFQSGAGQPHVYWKNIKNIEILLPSLTKQKEIAQTLDKAGELIELRKATIQKLDELAQSIFIDMFGDPISNNKQTPVKGFLEIFDITTGKLDSNASEENGIYPFFTCAQETLQINQFAFDLECLLLAGNNAAGKYSVKYYNGKFNAYQRTYILTLKNTLSSYKFFKYALELKLSELQNKSIGSNTKYLTLKILERVKMFDPIKEKQQEFTFQIGKIESQKSFYESELTKLQATFDALLAQSFEG